jgi:hypothetical protein
MSEFVDNNAGFEVTISIGGSSVPHIHTATAVLTVGRLAVMSINAKNLSIENELTVMKLALL